MKNSKCASETCGWNWPFLSSTTASSIRPPFCPTSLLLKPRSASCSWSTLRWVQKNRDLHVGQQPKGVPLRPVFSPPSVPCNHLHLVFLVHLLLILPLFFVIRVLVSLCSCFMLWVSCSASLCFFASVLPPCLRLYCSLCVVVLCLLSFGILAFVRLFHGCFFVAILHLFTATLSLIV